MKLFHRFSRARRRAFTLVEILIASGLGAIVVTAIASLAYYSGRSFAALANYVELDMASRNALDVMTKDIRQANQLTHYSTNRLIFSFPGGRTLMYSYDPNQRTLTRTLTNERDRQLLKECDFLTFSIFQRNSLGGTYDQYPVATPGTCKVVQLNWVCSRKILKETANTESVQSAKIVIRRQ